jgi:hypothetical protein
MISKLDATGTLVWTGRGSLGYNEIRLRFKIRGQKEFVTNFVLETSLPSDAVMGSKIDVEGFVRTVKMSDLDGRTRYVQYLAARSIRKSAFNSGFQEEYGIKTLNTAVDKLNIAIEGTVIDVKLYPNYCQLLLIRIPVKNGDAVVSLRADTKDLPNLKNALKPGDIVIATATTYTKNKLQKSEDDNITDLFIVDIGRKARARKPVDDKQDKNKVKMNPKKSIETTFEILPP